MITARPANHDLEEHAERIVARRAWKPHPGPQTDFLRRREFEAGYGGAKGGGKTDGVLYGGLRQIRHPRYHATMFRRTYPELQEAMDRAAAVFPELGATWSEQKHRWTFPSEESGLGARYSFFHCQNEKDVNAHNGKEYHYLGIDQLEQFTEAMFTLLIGCCRTSHRGIAIRSRSSFNPGGPGHVFVRKRYVDLGAYVPYIDPETGLSRVFVPATVWDNPAILENDPAYVQRLLGIADPALRAAYLEGRWDVFSGQFFSRWHPEVHTCEAFNPPDWWVRTIGMDYGGSAAPTPIMWTAWDDFGRPWTYKELTLENETSTGIADAIAASVTCEQENLALARVDPSLFTRIAELGRNAQGDGVSIAQRINERLAERGCSIVLTPANNDRFNGWARIHDYMDPRRPSPDPDEKQRQQPYWRIMRADVEQRLGCPMLIETLPAQIHDPKKIGDLAKGPTDHWCDAIRYDLIAAEELSPIPLELVKPRAHHQRIHDATRKAYLRALRNINEQHLEDAAASGDGELPLGIVDPERGDEYGDLGDTSSDLAGLWD